MGCSLRSGSHDTVHIANMVSSFRKSCSQDICKIQCLSIRGNDNLVSVVICFMGKETVWLTPIHILYYDDYDRTMMTITVL